jgi:hypothetical protein
VRTSILLAYLPFRSCSLARVGRSLRCTLLLLDAALKSSSCRSTLQWSRRNPFRSLSVSSRSPYVCRGLQCSLDSRVDAPLSLSSLGSFSISDGGTSIPLSLCLLKINKLKTRSPVRAGVRTLGISGNLWRAVARIVSTEALRKKRETLRIPSAHAIFSFSQITKFRGG